MNDVTVDLFSALQQGLGPQYRLERELGRGGMGVVFRATDTTLDRRVAVKVVHPELTTHGSVVRRFLAEARTIARLRHPSIVAVHSAGSADGLLYYVMDEVGGETLRERLNRAPRLSVAEVGRIVDDLAAALDAAARAGVVHRDIKPENVLLDAASGRAMLADFGIARAMEGDGTEPATGQGIAVGTPAYMSPEQASGEQVDCRSDIYALGILAYEMLTGRPPFQGPYRVVVSKHIAERPVPVARLRGEVPAALAATVMRALAKDPHQRWQTGEAMRQALVTAPPEPDGSRRRVTAAVVAVLCIALALAAAFARRTPGPPAGIDPRRSLLVLPFGNLRQDRAVEWLRDGSVSMLGLNLSQWNDLSVVDHERLHDLLAAEGLGPGSDIGLETARRIARKAGVWTVVLGEYARAADSLHLVARVYDVASGRRVDVARADGRASDDVRPLFDELAAKLLDLSGAPNEIRIGLAQSTTPSLLAFRSYLGGVEALNRWDLGTAEREFGRAIGLDSAFGLAYYKLALTRGWLVGASDSIADRAILHATAHSANLPAHERTVIGAYGAFLGQDFTEARALYQQLLARDGGDADAWYGLGEAWFHDTAGPSAAPSWSQAMRAFRRTLRLDPAYALAYDHVHTMLSVASMPSSPFALVGPDSFAVSRTPSGRMLLDSATVRTGMQRARRELVATARRWVATQPAAVRAHGAMVDAYLAVGRYDAALSEIGRFREVTGSYPELPFVEARVRFAAGDVDRAAAELRRALDTATVGAFRSYEGAPTVVSDVASAANVFAYQGDLASAAKAIDFADQVRREVIRNPASLADGPMSDGWKRSALGELYASAGGPVASLRQVWQSAAEAARSAPPAKRAHLAHTGATAAIGLFTGASSDSTALGELRALSGEPLPREVRALLALGSHDSTTARRLLAGAASAGASAGNADKPMYRVYTRPLTAQAYYLLGDYQATLRILHDFEPGGLQTRGFDSRWGIVGRVRLLRGAALERLGRRAEARAEYHRVLAQWRSADASLNEYKRQAEQGLARVGEIG